MRRRASSSTTTHPLCKASSTAARFAIKTAAWRSGLLFVACLKRTNEGLLCALSASKVPKSVSAETTMRSSCCARSKISSSVAPVARNREHERHRGLAAGEAQRRAETWRCRREISRSNQWQLPFAHSRGRVLQCLKDVVALKIGISRKDFRL